MALDNGFQGLHAEWFFYRAMMRLGYEAVEKTDPACPYTIRKSTPQEEALKQDFILTTLDQQGVVKVVPVQLTLSNSGTIKNTKKSLARAGIIALFWPTAQLSFEAAYQFLKKAATGETGSLLKFRGEVQRMLEDYFKVDEGQREQSRRKWLEEERWRRIQRGLPRFPRKLRIKIHGVNKSGLPLGARLRQIEDILAETGTEV